MIKDSGDRTEFETGAKRDMHAGKGRMDLLPWYGIMEVSKHCEEGALKYGEHNVDKGIPLHSLLDSASRHLAKYMVGMDDEDHLRAACWNLLWALNQRETHPELDDRFAVKVGEVKKKNYQVLCPNCEATMALIDKYTEVETLYANNAPIEYVVKSPSVDIWRHEAPVITPKRQNLVKDVLFKVVGALNSIIDFIVMVLED